MAININQIDDSQALSLIRMQEGHFSEKKGIRISPAKISKTISAFANADGGDLYIGLTDKSGPNITNFIWEGFSKVEDANGHLQVLDQLFPLGDDYDCCFLSSVSHDGFVLHVNVRKNMSIIESTDKTPYIRLGAQSLPVNTPEKIRKLELNKGITSYESDTVGIDIDVITNSDVISNFIENVIPSSTPEAWLRKQLLIHKQAPTVAGVLLFSDLPQAALPKRSGIKISRYKTNAPKGSREALHGLPESIEGCAYDIIKNAVSRTQAIIEETKVLSESDFESILYPPEALHEVITNAVIHRDYSIADDVHVRIFDNRVEVESPGKLAGHVTVANILKEGFRRNGKLVRILNKFPDPPNKDIGEGLNTAFEVMTQHRLKPPLIRQTESSVVVEIRHEKLASPEETVMNFLKSNKTISNSQARELCGISSENSMKRVFYRLRDCNKIERVPGASGARSLWRVVDNTLLPPQSPPSNQIVFPFE